MAAAATDKVRKKKSLFQTTLNGGIGAGDASLTLQSASGLPTDTGVTIVINRVDANGTATPSLMEVVTGVVSGSTVGSLVRAEDGTSAKSHANASVVEMVWDAETWNDFCDAYLSEHNQDGTHKAAAITTPIVAASADTLADGDLFGWADVSASNVLKKITWANIKATLKTYFDTLYGSLASANTWTAANTFTGTVIAKLNLAEGTIINGKISVTDTGSGLQLALKGLDGNDPSASNPVYVILNSVVRSVTSALSVTKADGTNWCNSGGAELATKEIDYFAYLGYNATDGVVIGFSRIPGARQYSDFSTTTTNEKYCAISTITNAASTDYYAVVGRFAATLSAGAGYTWSVPTYTAINLIQQPIYESRDLDQVLGLGNVTEGNGTGAMKYRIVGNRVFAWGVFTWGSTTSASGTTQFTLPFTANNSIVRQLVGSFYALDTGTRHYMGIVSSGAAPATFVEAFIDDAGAQQIANNYPIVWANGDIWAWEIVYTI